MVQHGKDDFLLQTTRSTVDLLKKHGFDVTYAESSGGHTWLTGATTLLRLLRYCFRSR